MKGGFNRPILILARERSTPQNVKRDDLFSRTQRQTQKRGGDLGLRWVRGRQVTVGITGDLE